MGKLLDARYAELAKTNPAIQRLIEIKQERAEKEAAEEAKKAEEEARSENNSIPTISLKNMSSLQIDVDKQVQLEFILGKKTLALNMLYSQEYYVELINTNDNITLSTTKWSTAIMRQPFNINITIKKAGAYIIKSKIDEQWSNMFIFNIGWIRNDKTGEITWNKKVASSDNPMQGYTYLGATYAQAKKDSLEVYNADQTIKTYKANKDGETFAKCG